jgi:hypothetical protein
MKALAGQINELDSIDIYGRVVGVRGLMVEVAGLGLVGERGREVQEFLQDDLGPVLPARLWWSRPPTSRR